MKLARTWYSLKKLASFTFIFIIGCGYLGLDNPQNFAKAQGATTAAPQGLVSAAQLALVTQLGVSPKTYVWVGDIHADQEFAYGIVANAITLLNTAPAPRVYWFVAHQTNSVWHAAIEYNAAFYSLVQMIPSDSIAARIKQYVLTPRFDIDLINMVQKTVINTLHTDLSENVLVSDVKVDQNFAVGVFIVSGFAGSEGGPTNQFFAATHADQGWQVELSGDNGGFYTMLDSAAFQIIKVSDSANYVPPEVPSDLIVAAKTALISYLGNTRPVDIWIDDINVIYNFAAGTLMVPSRNGAKGAAQKYSFIAKQTNHVWQVAFYFTPEFNAIIRQPDVPVQILSPDQRQYLITVDDPGNVTLLAEQALIMQLGYLPKPGILAANIKLDQGYAYGTLAVPASPDENAPHIGVVFIGKQSGQTWQVVLEGTPAFKAMLPGVPLSLMSAQEKSSFGS